MHTKSCRLANLLDGDLTGCSTNDRTDINHHGITQQGLIYEMGLRHYKISKGVVEYGRGMNMHTLIYGKV